MTAPTTTAVIPQLLNVAVDVSLVVAAAAAAASQQLLYFTAITFTGG
jgi:hypothetical protein